MAGGIYLHSDVYISQLDIENLIYCSAYGGEERCIQDFFGGGDMSERDHLGDPGLDGRIMKMVLWDVGVWTGSS